MIHHVLIIVQVDILVYSENIGISQHHANLLLIFIYFGILRENRLEMALVLWRLSSHYASEADLQRLLDFFWEVAVEELRRQRLSQQIRRDACATDPQVETFAVPLWHLIFIFVVRLVSLGVCMLCIQ